MGAKDQECRAADIGKCKSVLTFTFTQFSVWDYASCAVRQGELG